MASVAYIARLIPNMNAESKTTMKSAKNKQMCKGTLKYLLKIAAIKSVPPEEASWLNTIAKPNDTIIEPNNIFIILSSPRATFGTIFSKIRIYPETAKEDIRDFLAKSNPIKIMPARRTITFSVRFTKPKFKNGNALDNTRANPESPPAAISWLSRKKYNPPPIRKDPNKIHRYFFIQPPYIIIKCYHKMEIYSIKV